jgi:hypothetical protein
MFDQLFRGSGNGEWLVFIETTFSHGNSACIRFCVAGPMARSRRHLKSPP